MYIYIYIYIHIYICIQMYVHIYTGEVRVVLINILLFLNATICLLTSLMGSRSGAHPSENGSSWRRRAAGRNRQANSCPLARSGRACCAEVQIPSNNAKHEIRSSPLMRACKFFCSVPPASLKCSHRFLT